MLNLSNRATIGLSIFVAVLLTAVDGFQADISAADSPVRSHPSLRTVPPAAQRPLAKGVARFVDAKNGDDAKSGAEAMPWRTLAHACGQLQPGETLYLRGGTYYEPLYLGLQGRADAPITIRSYPGEQAIVDGSLRQFSETPEKIWEPCAGGSAGEYRTVNRWPNLRDVIGYFGDSQVGLQTYWHRQDLQSTSETFTGTGGKGAADKDVDPIYLGPGLWYDQQTGYLHCRLSHTQLPAPLTNYRGETDPRKLPLTIAAYRSTPLFLDQAEHVQLQDLVIRGGGYVTVLMEQAKHVALDNVTIFAGGYGIRAISTTDLSLTNCGLHGSLAPWTFRSDASKRDYPGRPHRNISRLNTHALIELDAGRESSVWATPQNDRWKISHCHFTDSHDGVYLGAMNVEFDHNLIENMQDDGIYLSPMYQRHKLDGIDPKLVIHHNVFRQLLTALAFGGNEPNTHDLIYVYRNIFDLRQPIMASRMSETKPEPSLTSGKLIGDHGSPPWSTTTIAFNTVIASGCRDAGMTAAGAASLERPRRVFNNLFIHTDRLPAISLPAVGLNLISDGNLYWAESIDAKTTDAFFKKYRATPFLAENKKLYEAGSESHSLIADPKLMKLAAEPAQSDYRIQTGSAAINSGVELAWEGFDPLSKEDQGQPDLGAIPHGGAMFEVGRHR
ncbi:hypothetical protein ETAA8_14880 [Anatilimnocola aggregata]|uniref:Uncharacterized protein n=1 Tax=Anatilimnocola aggregata TaxID=2528021 RepID=A0A517Y849_9BACT|nr:right-handed parallel beta-helix repeat-containing protein [Anatilimnocola aggregata]QDU26410.1 hypothetical protein ETAA8_14880 [Anatilimnocola aggregata]